MIDKTTLQPVPAGTELTCYKCKQVPAAMYKWMKTPSGGQYRRGWCHACLTGVSPSRNKKFAAPRSTSSHRFRTGQQVAVAFTGRVRTYLHGKNKGMVQVQVGKRLYIVEEAWLQGG